MYGLWMSQALLGQAAVEPGALDFLPLIFIGAIMYFIIIRPETKRKKEHAELLSSLQKGDEVVTASGMLGKIVGIEDSVVQIEIADRVKVKLLKERIAGRWADKANASS